MTKIEVTSFVEILQYEGDVVVKRMGPMSRRSAETVDAGANINLNHDQFYTRIVDEKEKHNAKSR